MLKLNQVEIDRCRRWMLNYVKGARSLPLPPALYIDSDMHGLLIRFAETRKSECGLLRYRDGQLKFGDMLIHDKAVKVEPAPDVQKIQMECDIEVAKALAFTAVKPSTPPESQEKPPVLVVDLVWKGRLIERMEIPGVTRAHAINLWDMLRMFSASPRTCEVNMYEKEG